MIRKEASTSDRLLKGATSIRSFKRVAVVGEDLNNPVRPVYEGFGLGVNSARVKVRSTLDEDRVAHLERNVSNAREVKALFRVERVELKRLVSGIPYDLALTEAGGHELREFSWKGRVADEERVKPEARGT